MSAWEQTLRHEFEAGDGSFLIQLRSDLVWDRDAFSRLTDAMRECAADHESSQTRDRWIAEGYWYLATFVEEWSSHPNFPRPLGASYYEAAYQRLSDLAYWFFRGESPYTSDHKGQLL